MKYFVSLTIRQPSKEIKTEVLFSQFEAARKYIKTYYDEAKRNNYYLDVDVSFIKDELPIKRVIKQEEKSNIRKVPVYNRVTGKKSYIYL